MSSAIPEPALSTPARLQPVLQELQRLEPLFHAAAPGATPRHFERLVSPQFWEIGASGRRYSRAFALDALPSRGGEPGAEQWQTSDFHVAQVGEDLYLLTYSLRQPGRLTLRATLWQREDGRWQAVFHQGTVVAGHG